MSEALIGQVYNSATTIAAGGTQRTPTAGYRYLSGYAGETTAQALQHLEDLIQLSYAAATVTLSLTTGLVTIAFGATGTLAWAGDGSNISELKAIAGFAIDIPSSTGATGTLTPKGLWLPSRCAASYPLDKERVWSYETTTKTVRSTDGSSFAVTGSSSAARADIAYRLLTRNEMVRDADPETGTLEQFFADVAAAGLPLRYLPDTTSYAAASDYAQGFWELDQDSSAFTDFASRTQDGYDGLWDVDIPLIKYDA